ncbi:MAG: glycosyl hydrolase-related protein [Spirochaetia bacterium]|jgi:alpha-mannosidase|nr:glycosyl hydrolase-related protein [Spirochaetia bacterium]
MVLIKERIGKLIEYLGKLRYPMTQPIEHYRMLQSNERFTDVAKLDTSTWKEFDHSQIWGGHRVYYWFDTSVVIPEDFAGMPVFFELRTGKENQWDATNPQFSFYVDGKLTQGMDVNHRLALLCKDAVPGTSYRITLSAFTGDQNFSLKLDGSIKPLDKEVDLYWYDLKVPYDVARLLPSDDTDYIAIIKALNESLNLLDMRKEDSPAFRESLGRAHAYLKQTLYGNLCGPRPVKVYCIGHTHIDCAWLWTHRVTQDKAVRSFSTVLELMREYPEYVFMSSQPLLYQYVKKNAPDIYAQIKQRVKEGRWEVEGGMYVEADCNLASGESLVRQFQHGLSFFKEEFGKDNSILWLPDVFGYSAALPQIMKKCGLSYFMTTKISWNEFNKMPYDTFEWEGIDGSKVLTHFIPTRDYHRAAVEGSVETEHFTSYNGYINPSQMKGSWERYSQKDLNNETLCCFGYGDGGGGPTRDMLENQRRLAQGIPGCPQTVMSRAGDFFRKLEAEVKGSKYLPKWVGELYLEYHRGTYTSMAKNKKYNRKSEFAYENNECYATLSTELLGCAYPGKELYQAWELILSNQFHDILPGSSIKEVYDDSTADYEYLSMKSQKLRNVSLSQLTDAIGAQKGSLILFNPNSKSTRECFAFTAGNEVKGLTDGTDHLPVQRLADGTLICLAPKIPSKGYLTLETETEQKWTASSKLIVKKDHLENNFFSLDFNAKGQLRSIYDKRASREIVPEGSCANRIVSYEDRPHNFDAWDVNNYYTEKSWEVDDVSGWDVVEEGPVRACIRIERKYLDSTITQYIYIYAGLDRIDIRNVINWKEHQIFLKDWFPVDVHAQEATFDIQYGNVRRTTHSNTSWDFAKFEVCVHKWLDISEDGFGVSFLNDCKYGCSVKDGKVGLSMLKSAIYPNPEADKELHEFTYAIYPHVGNWRDADTVGQAYGLNNPLEVRMKQTVGGKLPLSLSFVSVDCENVVIEVVKEAEDGKGMIIRLYECYNRRCPVTLNFACPIASIVECNMIEQGFEPVSLLSETSASFTILPYEIKTFRVQFT